MNSTDPAGGPAGFRGGKAVHWSDRKYLFRFRPWHVMQSNEFEATYRDYVDAVFRYTLRSVGNRELAEDITSEVFLELYRNRDSVDAGRLPAWLFTVARNRSVDYWRKTATELRYAAMTPAQETAAAPKVDLQTWLREEPTLKPIHRACLVMHFVHGMKRLEIAERLAISEIQVKGHLQYGLQLLRKAWDGANTGEPKWT
jgi:RNA polymerase sigma-70 factor, ECF subfamily